MGYSPEEIRAARKYINEIARENIFGMKGGSNFISLNGRDVEYLFNLYDVVFFQSQIRERIQAMEPPSKLKFYASERTSGAGGVCSIEKTGGECTYYIDIAPNIINTIFRRHQSGLGFAAGVGCEDRLECLQLIMEHQIIHLLMIVWEYYNSPVEGRDDENIYGTHGLLFQCMTTEYFGHTRFEHDLGLTSIDIGSPEGVPGAFLKYQAEKRGIIPFGYSYWSNSCYLDSLMIVLLGNVSTFWRMGIMDSKVDNIVYNKGVCISDIDTPEKLRDHARKIQTQIKADFKSLYGIHSQQAVRCSMLRTLLAKCLPGMKRNGTWVTYNVAETYETLASLFPGLLIDVPIQIHRWKPLLGVHVPDPVSYQRLATLAMWDYLDPLTNVGEEDDYKEIRWDLFQSPVIIFNNGGTPRIRKFDESGLETGFNIIQRIKHPFSVIKARAFGDTIIDERYRLVGVITLQGVPQSGEGGSHYVAHFMGTDEKWYYYNDLSKSGKVEPIKDLPTAGVWKEENGRMPAMYFYQLTKRENFQS